MHPFRLLFVASLTLSTSATAQWVQSDGTQGLNMQSLHSGINGLNFAGGQFGAYRSDGAAASFVSSNAGNDANGPTRGWASDARFIYTCRRAPAKVSSEAVTRAPHGSHEVED